MEADAHVEKEESEPPGTSEDVNDFFSEYCFAPENEEHRDDAVTSEECIAEFHVSVNQVEGVLQNDEKDSDHELKVKLEPSPAPHDDIEETVMDCNKSIDEEMVANRDGSLTSLLQSSPIIDLVSTGPVPVSQEQCMEDSVLNSVVPANTQRPTVMNQSLTTAAPEVILDSAVVCESNDKSISLLSRNDASRAEIPSAELAVRDGLLEQSSNSASMVQPRQDSSITVASQIKSNTFVAASYANNSTPPGHESPLSCAVRKPVVLPQTVTESVVNSSPVSATGSTVKSATLSRSNNLPVCPLQTQIKDSNVNVPVPSAAHKGDPVTPINGLTAPRASSDVAPPTSAAADWNIKSSQPPLNKETVSYVASSRKSVQLTIGGQTKKGYLFSIPAGLRKPLQSSGDLNAPVIYFMKKTGNSGQRFASSPSNQPLTVANLQGQYSRPVDSSKPSGSTERPPPSISSVNQSVITTPANASINPPSQIMSAPVRPVVASTDRLGQSHDSSNGEAVSVSSSPGAVQMTTNNNNGNTVTPCKVLTLPWSCAPGLYTVIPSPIVQPNDTQKNNQPAIGSQSDPTKQTSCHGPILLQNTYTHKLTPELKRKVFLAKMAKLKPKEGLKVSPTEVQRKAYLIKLGGSKKKKDLKSKQGLTKNARKAVNIRAEPSTKGQPKKTFARPAQNRIRKTPKERKETPPLERPYRIYNLREIQRLEGFTKGPRLKKEGDSVAWRAMVKTYQCKLCNYNTTSPRSICHHLIKKHKKVVGPLYDTLSNEKLPNSQSVLLDFVLGNDVTFTTGLTDEDEKKQANEVAVSKSSASEFAGKENESESLSGTKTIPMEIESVPCTQATNHNQVNSTAEAYSKQGCVEQPNWSDSHSNSVDMQLASQVPLDIQQLNQKEADSSSDMQTTNQKLPDSFLDMQATNQKLIDGVPVTKPTNLKQPESASATQTTNEIDSVGNISITIPPSDVNTTNQELQIKKVQSEKQIDKEMDNNISQESLFLETNTLLPVIRKYTYVTIKCPKCNLKVGMFKLSGRHRCERTSKDILCEDCGIVTSLTTYRRHYQIVHCKSKPVKKVKCSLCEKEVFEKTMRKHMTRHHSGKNWQVKCPICGKQLASSHQLRKHEAIHRAELPHKCNICYRSFAQRTNMTNHMRQHTGEQPYKCDHCSKCFTHKVSLKTHLKKYHGIDLWKEGHTGGGRPKKTKKD
ncbi:uncharacterized protein [Apostichopus japonicus]|uniref:uncharacterized protein isoform X3 n=1 Tax=Stichopus japonicus TaxID=307972 RepID=UPI003AB8D4C3